MIRSNIASFSSVVAVGLLLTACGGRKGAERADSLLVDADSIVSEADSIPTAELPTLCADSLGAVHIGMPVHNLPRRVAGLYDSFSSDQRAYSTLYSFVDEEGNQLFHVYDFGEGKVDLIELAPESPYGARVGDRTVHLGEPFSEVLALPGLRSEWVSYDSEGTNDGEWFWTAGDLWFNTDLESLTDSNGHTDSGVQSEPITQRRPPRAAVLSRPDIRITYIATGIPY